MKHWHRQVWKGSRIDATKRLQFKTNDITYKILEVCQTELLKRFIKIVKKQIKFGSTSLERKAKAKKKQKKTKTLLQAFMHISK